MELENTLLKHFSDIEDPRCNSHHNFRHTLTDIFIITVLATICGADGWMEIEEFAIAKKEWLSTFLSLSHGIPSHDTFGRVFSRLKPSVFETCFARWITSLSIDLKKEIIALDGKTLRGSGNKRQGHSAIHMVSAWATKNRMMLAQVKTEEKSNEITAIPELLKMIDIKDAIVTIDAMGCQSKIAQKIISQEADYVLSLKKNQPTLFKNVRAVFAAAECGKKKYKKIRHRRTIEKLHAHGRIETRRYTLVSDRENEFGLLARFPGLKGLGKVEITRTTQNKVEHSTRYFLTSLLYENLNTFMEAVRKHWQIEIDLHWSLDVSFREDFNQTNQGYAAENLALIRRIALNLLKQEKTHKNGISCRRKSAGWNHQYLLKVLTADQHFKTG